MKSICVSTDFGACSQKALSTAVNLAQRFDCRIRLFHCLDISEEVIRYQFEEDFDRMTQDAEQRMQAQIDHINEEALISIEVYERDYRTVVHELAKEEDTFLFVIGTRKPSDDGSWLLGTKAQQVVNLVSVPTLVVKDTPYKNDWTNIVFASNLYTESYRVFPFLRELLEGLEATLTLLKIVTPRQFETSEYIENLEANFKRELGVDQVDMVVRNAESVEQGVKEYCERNELGMLMMATHGRLLPNKLRASGVTEQLVQALETPIISLRVD